jgi:hypothetical protein
MFSNSEAISHMIQCDMPLMRSAIAVTAATAPAPTWPRLHSQTAVAGGAQDQAHHQRVVDDLEGAHQPHLLVAGVHELVIAWRAKPASRCVCENSLTVEMLV